MPFYPMPHGIWHGRKWLIDGHFSRFTCVQYRLWEKSLFCRKEGFPIREFDKMIVSGIPRWAPNDRSLDLGVFTTNLEIGDSLRIDLFGG